jgi:hypothetical protein
MGFLEFPAAGAPPAPPTDLIPADALRWSDAAAWNGKLPDASGTWTIEAGRTVVLDCDAEIGALRIDGTLLVAARDTKLRAGWIEVRRGGRLAAGSAEHPFRNQLTLTLCAGNSEPHPVLGSKFLAAIDGGTIELHGEARTSWVALGATVAPGHNTLHLARPTDWREGERIAIASGQDHALVEERTIVHVGADCLTLTLDRAVAHRHLGEQAPMRHMLPGSVAKVMLLARNVVVEGCAESSRSHVGGYCLIAGSAERSAPRSSQDARPSIGRFSGVEFRRMGQFDRPGRYPLHWHNNGDAAESSVVGCLIQDSYQRGIVTVGSRHVRISGNVVVRPYGHGFIVESEDNSPQLITTNLALRPRIARFADSKMRGYCEHHPRAFWIVRSHSVPHAVV